ncbi:uncharacterized protein J4E87_000611 [Alternaria ethzedia]|uniref:uncharacterized protein n=1 Tax=Alternaria ethzedia TaxID=181014 RepID=UPI0020C203EA|nr:uncharacterized protein J4E87_000611 [Alternaria ethzedia]KAI4635657.1 hypothetical protein J4E87_000611 [Alternaria ethzedia]
MSSPVDALHPSYILDHLVKVVLPEKCESSSVVADYYKNELADPDSAIAQCQSFLPDWVVELSATGKLREPESLSDHITLDFPDHGVIYVLVLIVDDEPWFYAGQARDGEKRLASCHENPVYRRNIPCFLYYLWERASAVYCCLPVSDVALTPGPIMNILEQWFCLMFLSLQPMDLQQQLSGETLRQIPASKMQRGINVRDPLAQPFGFRDYPSKNVAFRYSSEPHKLAYFAWRKTAAPEPRVEQLLRGDLYTGKITTSYDKGESLVYFGGCQFAVSDFFLGRIMPDTLRVHCDLLPAGEKHPHTIIGGMYSPAKYDDPARRLGIRLSALQAADGEETWIWHRFWYHDLDIWIPKMNRLVDWLERRNLNEARPRRFYPDSREKSPRGLFTRHPVDFKNKDSDEWKDFITFKELEKWNSWHA